MARRRALVDAGRQRAHLRHLVGHLLAHQMAAEPDLAALADEELARVRQPQMMRVEAVARLDALIEPLDRVAPLVGDHAALARARRRARHGGAAGERDLRLVGQRAEAHAGHIDRDVEHHRPLGARADHRLGVAFLAIALDDEAGQRAGQEGEIVPMRNLLEQREAAHAVAAELRLHMDVVDDLRREDLALAEDEALRLSRRLRAVALAVLAFLLIVAQPPRLTAPVSSRSVRDCRSSTIACRRRSCGNAPTPPFGSRSYMRSFRSSHARSRSVIVAPHRIDAEARRLAADIDRAVIHGIAEILAGIAADHHAPALHHEAGEGAGIAADDDGAALHVDAGARADIALADQVAAADRRAELRAGVLLDQDGAAHHVLGAGPADPAGDAHIGAVDQAEAEIAERAVDDQIEPVEDADRDRMLGAGILDDDGAVAVLHQFADAQIDGVRPPCWRRRSRRAC